MHTSITGLFHLAVKTRYQYDLTMIHYTDSISALSRGGSNNKGIPSGCYKNSPEPTRKKITLWSGGQQITKGFLLDATRIHQSPQEKKLLFFSFVLRSSQEPIQALQRNNGRLEAIRLPVSARLPSGGRAATLTPLSSMYSTRPCCLVQAITRHLCPDSHLGSWNCLPH